MLYVVVFIVSFVFDVIPVFGPPVWTGMVFMIVKYDLNPWLVLAIGVPASTLGRYVMSLYIPHLSGRIFKKRKISQLQFLGRKMTQTLWRSWVFVLTYSLLPLSTTALFTAAGVARVNPLHTLPPFFVGKFTSDAIMVLSGSYAAKSASEIIHGAGSWQSILVGAVGLLLLGALIFVDWRQLLEKRRLVLDFHVFS